MWRGLGVCVYSGRRVWTAPSHARCCGWVERPATCVAHMLLQTPVCARTFCACASGVVQLVRRPMWCGARPMEVRMRTLCCVVRVVVVSGGWCTQLLWGCAHNFMQGTLPLHMAWVVRIIRMCSAHYTVVAVCVWVKHNSCPRPGLCMAWVRCSALLGCAGKHVAWCCKAIQRSACAQLCAQVYVGV